MMVPKQQPEPGEHIPDPEEIRDQYPIEEDADATEPADEQFEELEINTGDIEEVRYWAGQFEISEEALRMAIALNGNKVNQLRKYLSI